MKWQNYISSDKEVLLGRPTIKGTRISVELILELLENGWTQQVILESYPSLKPEHFPAIFSFLKECMEQEFLVTAI